MSPAFLIKKTSLFIIGSLALAGAAGMAYAFSSGAGSLSSNLGDVAGMQDVSNQNLVNAEVQSGAAAAATPGTSNPGDGSSADSQNTATTNLTINGQPVTVPDSGSVTKTITNNGQTTQLNVTSHSSTSGDGSKHATTNTSVTSRTRSNTNLDTSP